MARILGCLAVCLFLALPASASELDQEFQARTDLKGPVVSDVLDNADASLLQTSELDGETPTQACGWRRGFGVNVGFGGFGAPRFGGIGWGGGWGGYGVRYTSIGIGYGGFGYPGWGWGGGGWGGGGWGGGFSRCYW